MVWGKCRITGMSVLGLGAVLLGTELPDPQIQITLEMAAQKRYISKPQLSNLPGFNR